MGNESWESGKVGHPDRLPMLLMLVDEAVHWLGGHDREKNVGLGTTAASTGVRTGPTTTTKNKPDKPDQTQK